MYKYFGRVAVIARCEATTTIPEFRHLPSWWNKRARGLGGTLQIPISIGGEENLLCLPEDRYYGDDIFVHEVAHAVAEISIRGGAIPGFYPRLEAQWNVAKHEGLWRDTYSLCTVREYFAEGVQIFFNCHVAAIPNNGIHNSINTREKLLKYDPGLYCLLKEVFPCMNTYHRCEVSPPSPNMDCTDQVKKTYDLCSVLNTRPATQPTTSATKKSTSTTKAGGSYDVRITIALAATMLVIAVTFGKILVIAHLRLSPT